MLPKIDKWFDWSKVQDWIIDIPVTEAGLDYELMKNPINAYKSGMTPIQMIKRTQKVDELTARNILKEWEETPSKYPNFYNMIMNVKQDRNQSSNNSNNLDENTGE